VFREVPGALAPQANSEKLLRCCYAACAVPVHSGHRGSGWWVTVSVCS
jgi:hypothetical protein